MSNLSQAGFDIRRIWNGFKRRIFVILVPLLVGLIALYCVAMLLPPVYEAETILSYNAQEKEIISSKKSVFDPVGNRVSDIAARVDIMQSVLVLRRVVEKLQLHKDEEFMSNSRADIVKRRIKKLVVDYVPFEILSKDSEEEEEVEELSENAMILEAVYRINANLNVNADNYTFLVRITFTSTDPVLAARIANEVAEAYLAHELDTRYEAAKRATTWLTERIGLVRKELEQAEEEIEAYKAQHDLLDATGSSRFKEQLSLVNEKLESATAAATQARIQLEKGKKLMLTGGSTTVKSGGIEFALLNDLRKELFSAKQRRAQVGSRLGRSHPKVKRLQAEVSALESQVKDERQKIIVSLEDEYKAAKEKLKAIKERATEIREKDKKAQGASVKLRQLELNAKSIRDVYQSFLGRLKETSQYEHLQSTDFRVVSQAQRPEEPFVPAWALIAVAVAIGSLGTGAAAAFVLEFLDPRLRTVQQIEEQLGLPVVSVIPRLSVRHLHEYEQFAHLQQGMPRSRDLAVFWEAVRQIRTEVQLSNRKRPPKSVLITSPSSNEGKTTLSYALARSTARLGVRTVLLDCDLRKASIIAKLDTEPKKDLVDIITGNATIEDATVIDDASGLAIIPTVQPVNEEAGELLASEGMQELVRELNDMYDFVIIDAPPVMPVQDARTISSLVDGVLIVFSQDDTAMSNAKKTITKLKLVSANIIGLIVNKSDGGSVISYYSQPYGYMVPSRNSRQINQPGAAKAIELHAEDDEADFEEDSEIERGRLRRSSRDDYRRRRSA